MRGRQGTRSEDERKVAMRGGRGVRRRRWRRRRRRWLQKGARDETARARGWRRRVRDRVLYRGEIAKFSTGVHILTALLETEKGGTIRKERSATKEERRRVEGGKV